MKKAISAISVVIVILIVSFVCSYTYYYEPYVMSLNETRSLIGGDGGWRCKQQQCSFPTRQIVDQVRECDQSGIYSSCGYTTESACECPHYNKQLCSHDLNGYQHITDCVAPDSFHEPIDCPLICWV